MGCCISSSGQGGSADPTNGGFVPQSSTEGTTYGSFSGNDMCINANAMKPASIQASTTDQAEQAAAESEAQKPANVAMRNGSSSKHVSIPYANGNKYKPEDFLDSFEASGSTPYTSMRNPVILAREKSERNKAWFEHREWKPGQPPTGLSVTPDVDEDGQIIFLPGRGWRFTQDNKSSRTNQNLSPLPASLEAASSDKAGGSTSSGEADSLGKCLELPPKDHDDFSDGEVFMMET